jgi:hypothetical protein
MNSTDLARLHVETAVKLTSVAHVRSLLDAIESVGATTATAATAATPKSTRGRKPGAAAPESRCHWNVGTESQCKNNQKDGNSYCGMHIGKIHLIDPVTSAPASLF